MRRWIARTVVCLILGAITTVAVAWGCATWVPVAMKSHDDDARAMTLWNGSPVRDSFRNASEPTVISWAGSHSGQNVEIFCFLVFDWTLVEQPELLSDFLVEPPRDDIAYGSVSSGWPLLALQGGVWR